MCTQTAAGLMRAKRQQGSTTHKMQNQSQLGINGSSKENVCHKRSHAVRTNLKQQVKTKLAKHRTTIFLYCKHLWQVDPQQQDLYHF